MGNILPSSLVTLHSYDFSLQTFMTEPYMEELKLFLQLYVSTTGYLEDVLQSAHLFVAVFNVLDIAQQLHRR